MVLKIFSFQVVTLSTIEANNQVYTKPRILARSSIYNIFSIQVVTLSTIEANNQVYTKPKILARSVEEAGIVMTVDSTLVFFTKDCQVKHLS